MKRKKEFTKLLPLCVRIRKDHRPIRMPFKSCLLIASPLMQEEAYVRAVVLLVYFDKEEAIGFILNKPSDIKIGESIDELENAKVPLYLGGMNSMSEVHYIHNDGSLPDAEYIGNGYYWGGDYQELRERVKQRRIKLDKFRFCAGYIVWDQCQLYREVKQKKWWVEEFTLDFAFKESPEDMWSKLLIASDHIYGLMDNVSDIIIEEKIDY